LWESGYQYMDPSVGFDLAAAGKVDASSLLVIYNIGGEPLLPSHYKGCQHAVSGSDIEFKQGFYWQCFLLQHLFNLQSQPIAYQDNRY
jgi:hypothetical protein